MILSSVPQALRGARVLAVGALLAAVLAGCGGGTSQFEPFAPQRYFAFGDESSTLTNIGRKYSVNAVDGGGQVDCGALPLWVQSVSNFYSFVFGECNLSSVASPQAKMYASAGAKAEDVQLQIDAQIAAGGFSDKDMTTVLAGANDILELYAQFPNRTEADLVAEAGDRGQRLAAQINRLVGFGAKVIVSNVPDMGLSPFALKEKAANTDTDRAALISRITAAFNAQLGVKIILDGRYVGLVQADLQTQAMARSPLSFGLVNVSDAVCAVKLPACTTQTLVDTGDAATWMWADDTHLGYPGQAQIGQLAVARAQRNPF